MVIIVADNIPNSIRGKMKLWFIELKPNVFVSGVNDYLAQKIVKYLFKKSSLISGMTIIVSQRAAPGYRILSVGTIKKKVIDVSGLQLIAN